jgi:hypothetical protein
LAPPSGVIVAAEDVRFENVDFVWRNPPQRIVAPDQIAIVDQRARHTEFVGCTFQAAAAGTFGLPPALRMHAAGARSSTLAPACQVRLERCTIGDVATAVEGASAGPMAIAIHDTLYVASGPLIRLNEPPAIDAPIAIELKHLTARGASSVLEIAGGRSSSLPGAIGIEAVACALALQPTGALLTFAGPQLPKTASNGRVPIDWTGQGSLSQIDTVVANWHHDGTSETLPDDLMAVEGLVTGKLEFAAAASADPATSRLMYWLAPLFSDDPPGIGESLPKLPP